MGCFLSTSQLERDYESKIENALAPLNELFDMLSIGSKEQRQLYKVFDRMDRDGGKKIDFEEFCAFFVSYNKLNKFSFTNFLLLFQC